MQATNEQPIRSEHSMLPTAAARALHLYRVLCLESLRPNGTNRGWAIALAGGVHRPSSPIHAGDDVQPAVQRDRVIRQ